MRASLSILHECSHSFEQDHRKRKSHRQQKSTGNNVSALPSMLYARKEVGTSKFHLPSMFTCLRVHKHSDGVMGITFSQVVWLIGLWLVPAS
eukprot:153465-Pelagomonas_calceolata.AAC.1